MRAPIPRARFMASEWHFLEGMEAMKLFVLEEATMRTPRIPTSMERAITGLNAICSSCRKTRSAVSFGDGTGYCGNCIGAAREERAQQRSRNRGQLAEMDRLLSAARALTI